MLASGNCVHVYWNNQRQKYLIPLVQPHFVNHAVTLFQIILGISLLKEEEVETGSIVLLTCALVHALGLPFCVCIASRDYRDAMISVLRRKTVDQEVTSRGSQRKFFRQF